MFTGIIEGIGSVLGVSARKDGVRRIRVRAPFALGRLPPGASIAVDGVCLTVIARLGRTFSAELGPETLARTTLARLSAGARVHLERPLRLGDPLGGHLVAGHVDGTGTVVERRPIGRTLELVIELPAPLAAQLTPKGSVTVEGASLTVNRVQGRRFSVLLIPHTLKMTCLGERAPGARVNIETDLIAKHVEKYVRQAVRRLNGTRRATSATRKDRSPWPT